MKKRIISMILMIVISISYTTIPSSAANTILSIGSISGKAGETVSVPIKISGNSGICGFGLYITYDSSVMTPKKVSSGDVWKTDLISKLTYKENVVFVAAASASNKTKNGTLFLIDFEIKKNVKDAKYIVKLSSDSLQKLTSDYSLADVNAAVKNGSIQIGTNKEEIDVNSDVDESSNVQIKTFQGALSKYDENKAFTFSLPYASKVYINFEHESNDNDHEYWYVQFLDKKNKNKRDSFSIKGNDTNFQTKYMFLPKGEYIVIVNGTSDYWWSNESFQININYQRNVGLFETEDNDSMSFANKISKPNIMINGAIGNGNGDFDDDWFKYTLSSAGKVDISFIHEFFDDSHQYWKVKLIDGNSGEKLIEMDISGNLGITQSYYSVYVPKGTYYVVVSGFTDYWYTTQEYFVSLNYENNNGQYEIENNDNFEKPNSITIGKEIEGNIWHGNDVDNYTFSLSKSKSITVNLKHNYWDDSHEFWIIEILNANTGEKIESFSSTGSSINVSSKSISLKSGKYIIKVKGYTDYWYSRSSYKLTVK